MLATGTPAVRLSVSASLSEDGAALGLAELALWLAEEDGDGAAALLLAGEAGLALAGGVDASDALDAAGLGAAGTGVAVGVGSAVGLGLTATMGLGVATELGVVVGVGAGDEVWAVECRESAVMDGWSAALELSSSDRKLPLPSAVEDAVLVPDISAVRVLVLRAVLVSESTLISAFQTYLCF